MDPELVQGMLVLLELLHTLEIKKKINFKSMIQLTVKKLQCLYLRINLCAFIYTLCRKVKPKKKFLKTNQQNNPQDTILVPIY